MCLEFSLEKYNYSIYILVREGCSSGGKAILVTSVHILEG